LRFRLDLHLLPCAGREPATLLVELERTKKDQGGSGRCLCLVAPYPPFVTGD
jgi:hypothetical protein